MSDDTETAMILPALPGVPPEDAPVLDQASFRANQRLSVFMLKMDVILSEAKGMVGPSAKELRLTDLRADDKRLGYQAINWAGRNLSAVIYWLARQKEVNSLTAALEKLVNQYPKGAEDWVDIFADFREHLRKRIMEVLAYGPPCEEDDPVVRLISAKMNEGFRSVLVEILDPRNMDMSI